MNKVVRTIILIIVFIGVLFAYKTVRAEHIIDCNASYNIKVFAQCKVTEKWDRTHWKAFDYIISHESGWKNEAQNPNSTAYGLGQFLDSTWDMVEYEKTNNERIQILATIQYIDKRYGSPKQAQNYWKVNHHY